VIQLHGATVYHGNNLDILPTLPDNSIDAIVTDPPYELGFMGKSWDASGIAYNVELWKECLRVLKPGGHLLSFGGSRTFHRIAVAIEDAGFEIRDNIAWLYGSGFPKSLDISKAIDKAAGAPREVIGKKINTYDGSKRNPETHGNPADQSNIGNWGLKQTPHGLPETAPATPEAEAWNGWGTALKPAFEPVIVARKPLIGTVAQNVLEFGTGGLNIDGSRIGTEKRKNNVNDFTNQHGNQFGNGQKIQKLGESEVTGRWPANLILDEYTAELLDEQSGVSSSSNRPAKKPSGTGIFGSYGDGSAEYGDSGGASRFFYIAKASKADRNEGLDGFPDVMASKFAQDKWTLENMQFSKLPTKNFHPTVKPTQLMRYLIRLVTPPGGVVLDPFTGSGSTGKAAILEGFDFIGIELTEEYLPIIEGRLKHAVKMRAEQEEKKDEMLF
jgi:DNA modification methylase